MSVWWRERIAAYNLPFLHSIPTPPAGISVTAIVPLQPQLSLEQERSAHQQERSAHQQKRSAHQQERSASQATTQLGAREKCPPAREECLSSHNSAWSKREVPTSKRGVPTSKREVPTSKRGVPTSKRGMPLKPQLRVKQEERLSGHNSALSNRRKPFQCGKRGQPHSAFSKTEVPLQPYVSVQQIEKCLSSHNSALSRGGMPLQLQFNIKQERVPGSQSPREVQPIRTSRLIFRAKNQKSGRMFSSQAKT